MTPWLQSQRLDDVVFANLGHDLGCFDRETELDEFRQRIKGATRIELTICSCGGDSVVGIRLHDVLRLRHVEVLISGQCWSAAATVALAGRHIAIQRGGSILLHSPVAYAVGSPSELRAEAEQLEKLAGRIASIIAERTGQTMATVTNWLSRDTLFDCEKAKAAGLVDEIIEAPRLPCVEAPTCQGPSGVGPTEAEALFWQWATAFGQVNVRDRQAFGRELATWFTRSVKEES